MCPAVRGPTALSGLAGSVNYAGLPQTQEGASKADRRGLTTYHPRSCAPIATTGDCSVTDLESNHLIRQVPRQSLIERGKTADLDSLK